MERKYHVYTEDGCIISKAIDSAAVEATTSDTLSNPAADPVHRKNIPTAAEVLLPTCPNPDKGFQPLNRYQRRRIAQMTMRIMRALCKERGTYLDLPFWEQQTYFILSSQSTEEVLVVSSPAGSGKSTWIEAFAKALLDLRQTDSKLASSLVGITLVLQKVEDLNRLAEILNSDSSQDIPNMVALQGWTESGKMRGFCENLRVNSFDECRPSCCPHAPTCKMLSFRSSAPQAFIAGLTQERFVMLRDNGDLASILCRLDENGRSHPRRYLIFDEKFPMAQINTLDKTCLDLASIEFSELIGKISATDSQVCSLQGSLDYHAGQPFRDLRKSLRIPTEFGNQDIRAGVCILPSEYASLSRRTDFSNFCDFILCQKKQFATKHLRTALNVMTHLYEGEQCLFSKTNGFAVTSIEPPPLQYGESQAIIFDATAEIDEDYRCLQNAVFSEGIPQRNQRHLIFHIYTHADLNVSKRSMESPWKLPALSQFIANQVENLHRDEDIFLCCYKDCAEELAQKLKDAMSVKSFKHILLMPDREKDTIPYFGGTNGSNIFNTATAVFMLGCPRLDPRNYLNYACAAYGIDQIIAEIADIPQEDLTSKYSDCIWTLPSVKLYMAHHLAARMEQEIYRCKLRNPDFSGEINVYFFRPPSDMMDILCKRMAPSDVIYHDELPPCVELCKSTSRRYDGGSTSYGRLVEFLLSWDGTEIPVSQIRDSLGISHAVWKDLIKDKRVEMLLERNQILRKGRGANTTWVKHNQQECA